MALSRPAIAVLHTLAYTSVFSKSTTWYALSHWLLGPKRYTSRQIQAAIIELKKDPSWSQYARKVHRRSLQQEKWREVISFIWFIRHIPWIQSVWVTGSLGADSASTQDDIDFFIITDPNRLWLSRLLVIAGGLFLGRYRRYNSPSHQLKNRWCCNMWLESDRQTIFWLNQNLYTARELVQAKPVYARWDCQPERLLLANSWVKDWSATGWFGSVRRARHFARTPLSMYGSIFRVLPLFGLNALFFRGQYHFLRQHMTTEQVEKGVAFFHPRSLDNPVIKQYEKIVRQWKLSPLQLHL